MLSMCWLQLIRDVLDFGVHEKVVAIVKILEDSAATAMALLPCSSN